MSVAWSLLSIKVMMVPSITWNICVHGAVKFSKRSKSVSHLNIYDKSECIVTIFLVMTQHNKRKLSQVGCVNVNLDSKKLRVLNFQKQSCQHNMAGKLGLKFKYDKFLGMMLSFMKPLSYFHWRETSFLVSGKSSISFIQLCNNVNFCVC